MADITNPQAVHFANEKVRVFVEVLLSAAQTAEVFDEMYAALAGDTLFPNTADLIADGSEVDGRPRIQAQQVRAIRTIAQDLATWLATNSPTRLSRLRAATDKGESKF